MTDMDTCPLPELIESFRTSAAKALDENDMIRGMVYHCVAHRYDELLGVLKRIRREELYVAWASHNGKTEVEVKEMLGVG